jgi:G3E family GTPase
VVPAALVGLTWVAMSYQEPEFLPWDGRRVPLTFVAGYLGAGKTTLINQLLKSADRPIAVIVNDIGEINIDARLIRKHSGDTIELSDGCVCCSSIDGFGAAFDMIRARETPPDHVVVELSGVAEPARMVPWGRSAGFTLDGVMTLVAADQFTELIGRIDIGGTIEEQIRAADVLTLTKADLVRPDVLASVRRRLEQISPGVPIIEAQDPVVSTLLLQIGGRRPGAEIAVPEPTLFDRHVVGRIELPIPTTKAAIDLLLDALPADIMRAKGIAAGVNGERWAIQVVGRRRQVAQLADVEVEPPTDLVTISLPDAV